MIIALNNKSNIEKEEFKNYLEELKTIRTNETVIVCPTFLNIGMVSNLNVKLGAQNVSINENGAYTGEISASQLKSYQVQYTIVGHSERREYQKETDIEINQKIKQLLKNQITPILCVGETLEERKQNKVKEVLDKELTTAIMGLTEEEKKRIIVAYEPIWSIGTGVIPTKEEIEEVFEFIKEKYPNNKVLYGGSANLENIDMLKEISLIDGYLLGGLSLKVDELETFIDKLK
jgi:triosephosphate isomerase